MQALPRLCTKPHNVAYFSPTFDCCCCCLQQASFLQLPALLSCQPDLFEERGCRQSLARLCWPCCCPAPSNQAFQPHRHHYYLSSPSFRSLADLVVIELRSP